MKNATLHAALIAGLTLATVLTVPVSTVYAQKSVSNDASAAAALRASADRPVPKPDDKPPANAAVPAAGKLTVRITGFTSVTGNTVVALYTAGPEYPLNLKRAVQTKAVPVTAASGAGQSTAVEVVFDALPAGAYAVAAFHDANANGKVDLLRKGFTSEAHAYYKRSGAVPPKFEDATVDTRSGDVAVEIKLF